VDPPKCPVCGTESLVPAMHEGALRQVCRECERRRLSKERSAARQLAWGPARLLIYAGILLTVLTLTVDYLSISGRGGFGWRQITGTEVGILVVIIGLLGGRILLATSGLFLLVLSLGADVLNLGHAPGLGWRKQTALALAGVFIAGGFLWQRSLKKGNARAPVDEDENRPDQP